MKDKKNVLRKLFLSTLYLSAFTFGGGYVIVTLMKKKFGVAVAILGTIIPPFVIIALVSVCYNAFRSNVIVGKMLEGMQSGVGAVIASVTYEMGAGIVREKNGISLLIMAGAFLASCVFRVNVVVIVIVCGVLGALRTLIAKKNA